MSALTRFISRIRAWVVGNPFFGEADLFLAEQKKLQPILSASQQQEHQKHQRIQQLRDRPAASVSHERPHKLWDKF